MTQRIVIKTAVTRAAPTVKTVSYQWHWRRIAAASSLVLLSAAAVVYGLTNSVNADEISHASSIEVGKGEGGKNEVELVAQLPTPSSVVTALKQDVALQRETQPNDTQVMTGSEGSNTETLELTTMTAPQPTSAASTSDINVNKPVSVERDRSVTVVSSELQSSTLQVEPQVVFAENARVANVALGAKIDTNIVSRAVLTTGIKDREPIDVLKDNLKRTEFVEKLYFFTEIKNMQGSTIHHLWFHQDQLMAEIPLPISAVRYRTYSSKNIMPSQTGQWRVEVVTQDSQLLAQKSFRIISDTR